MRFSSTVLAWCLGVGVSVAPLGVYAPNPTDWSKNGGISSLGAPLDYLFGSLTGETPSPWPVDTSSPTGNCGALIQDSDPNAKCCIGTHLEGQTSPVATEDNEYGQCKNSGANNCPGTAKAFCNSGKNADNTHGGGSCPEYVNVPVTQTNLAGIVYPRCRLASATCGGHGQSHCWGILGCFLDEAGTQVTSCPPGGFTDYNSQGAPVTYFEGDFCFEDGNSDNTKWCGSCPANSVFVDTTDNKDTCQCVEGTVLDVTGQCCAGALDLNGHCCPRATSVWDPQQQVCCAANTAFDGHCCLPPNQLVGGVVCCEAEIVQGELQCKGGNPTRGDPQIGGFQGQSFQFHGLADEVFNLISAPTLQINSRFVYLSSGKCDYNDTQCWSHPGTYIDQLGFSFGTHRIKLIAGPHRVGMHIDMDGDTMTKGSYHFHTNETDVNIHFKHHGVVTIATHQFVFNIYNSDTFFNLEASMLDQRLLKIGEPKHTITDKHLCRKEESVDETQLQVSQIKHVHNHGAVEAAIDKKYGGAQVPLHGLIGQTWRNVLVCGKHWVGSVTDYLSSDLFASDYVFNFYHQE